MKTKLILIGLFFFQTVFAQSESASPVTIDFKTTIAVIKGTDPARVAEANHKVSEAIKQANSTSVELVQLSESEAAQYRSMLQGKGISDEESFIIYGHRWQTLVTETNGTPRPSGGGTHWHGINSSADYQREINSQLEAAIQEGLPLKEKKLEDAKERHAQDQSQKTTTTDAQGAEGQAPTESPKIPEQIELENALNSSKVVIMIMGASWCGICRYVEPKIDAIEQKYGASGLKVIRIDSSHGYDSRVGQLYHIARAIPAVRVYQNKKEVKSFDGGSDELYNIENWIGEYLK
jgi:thiol-disulfide isomerase/thioredoxin